jgi:hypothetical protein
MNTKDLGEAQAARRPIYKRWWVWVVGILAVLLIVGALAPKKKTEPTATEVATTQPTTSTTSKPRVHVSPTTTTHPAATTTSTTHRAPPTARTVSPSTTTTTSTTSTTTTTTTTTTTSTDLALHYAKQTCDAFFAFQRSWADLVDNWSKAVPQARQIGEYAQKSDLADASRFHDLFVAADNFSAYVDSTGWPRNGAPTDNQPIALQDACAAAY